MLASAAAHDGAAWSRRDSLVAATDGATELANILTGRASEVLETHGFKCEIGVPRVHVGALPGGIAVRMTTADGPIDIVLSMSTTEATPGAA